MSSEDRKRARRNGDAEGIWGNKEEIEGGIGGVFGWHGTGWRGSGAEGEGREGKLRWQKMGRGRGIKRDASNSEERKEDDHALGGFQEVRHGQVP